jgi:hypothetical protein
MNNPWEQWSPYWWQTVTAAPPLGMRFQPSATYAQPNDIFSSQSGSAWTPAAVPSAASSGILGQLGHPPNESSGYASPKPMSLLGQFLTSAHVASDSEWIANGNRGRGGQLCYACPKQVEQHGSLFMAL